MLRLQVGDIEDSEVEDDVSIQAHISAMQKELKKSCPDDSLIEDRMKRTLLQRRADVAAIMRIDLLLEKYPALTQDNHVSI